MKSGVGSLIERGPARAPNSVQTISVLLLAPLIVHLMEALVIFFTVTSDVRMMASLMARIPMTTGLGMTESAPFAISAHVPDWQAGVIGIPAPVCDVKLTPAGGKLEVRYRGHNITPGYWRQPDLTAESFDEEGFFCSGDAAELIDENNASSGLRFNGRIAEDFNPVSLLLACHISRNLESIETCSVQF